MPSSFFRSLVVSIFVLAAGSAAFAQKPSAAPAPAAFAVEFKPVRARAYPRPVENLTEAQIALARAGFSSGPIDGLHGGQSTAALRAFQTRAALPVTGILDDATSEALILDVAPLTQIAITAEHLAALQPIGKTWVEKSQQAALAYENALEFVAEISHAHHRFIEAINPGVDWNAVAPGTLVSIPAINISPAGAKVARIEIRLAERVLQARDEADRVILHFPVSIAKQVEKRPVGELKVAVIAPNPNYTFDPATFPESAEAQTLKRKLILPPGPNNPVGVAWIGLDKPGYGIHGTPLPEQVGRTESHGCFRLANWDARTLLDFAWVGLPITVLP